MTYCSDGSCDLTQAGSRMTYCWYFTREDIDSKTPSREDGIPAAVETRYRRDGAKFLINASNSFGLYPHL